jgi:hypothetical protein
MTLKTVQVESYTVTEAGMKEAIARVTALKRLGAMLETADEETAAALMLWPHLYGCIYPRISADDFFQIPETVLDKLVTVATELNPHWFTPPESKADEKKS